MHGSTVPGPRSLVETCPSDLKASVLLISHKGTGVLLYSPRSHRFGVESDTNRFACGTKYAKYWGGIV